jgi:hypothetical protein
MGFAPEWENISSSIFRKLIMHLFFSRGLILSGLLLLNGCDTNNDYALLASYPKVGACAIDVPQKNAAIKRNTEVLVRGWAFDSNDQTVPDVITLYLVHKESGDIKAFSGKRGLKREDVANAYKNSKLIHSGFDLTIKLPQPGNYEMVLLQADQDTGAISCAGTIHSVTVE